VTNVINDIPKDFQVLPTSDPVLVFFSDDVALGCLTLARYGEEAAMNKNTCDCFIRYTKKSSM